MSTQPATAEIKQLLCTWEESDGARSARAAVQHLLLFAGLADTSGSPGTFTSTTSVVVGGRAAVGWSAARIQNADAGSASYERSP